MPSLNDREVGAIFWAGRDPLLTVREVKSLGVRCGQLGVTGDTLLDEASVTLWRSALDAEQFTLVTVVAAYTGERYTDLPTVQQTVGFVPRATREHRIQRTLAVSDFAAALGVPGIACHVGFIPHDRQHPDYVAVRDAVRRVTAHVAQHDQTFALETGQETAAALRDFLEDVAAPNLKVNFDPANMILYGTGDPIEALDLLAPYIASVHVKDGDWPPKDQPDALGTERPLGQGAVGVERYVAKLKEIGFRGPLNIEREVEDHDEKLRDMRMGVELLERLV